jgi:hypothetical protein
MKKLIYGTLFLALVGISLVGCKKEFSTNTSQSASAKTFTVNVPFTKNGDVLIFQSWEDVNRLEEAFEKSIDDQNIQFEIDHSAILNTLRVPVAGSSINDPNGLELTWESELAIDSFEMDKGWSQYQSLIDFEHDNNFKSLRSKHYDLLYGDSESDSPSKLKDQRRVELLTFPIGNAMATMFNENAIIGVRDSLYKVLGNNVWISCTLEKKSILESLDESNYSTVIGVNGFKIYDIDSEKSSGCYANKKKFDDKTSNDNKYRIYGMMTVTHVGVANGRYIKGRTQAEMKNKKGKWKSRKTFCLVSGAAPLRVGSQCWESNEPGVSQQIINASFYNAHANRCERIDRFRSAVMFRVKSNTFGTYHKAGTGSNMLEFAMILD